MTKSNWPDEADVAEWQPMRREHDRIALIESRVRSAILGTAGTNRSSFLEAAQFAARQVVLGMEEALVEVWLRDLFSWNSLNAPMWASASCGYLGATSTIRRERPPDDLILAVMTAGRPLRFDDAADHHLVQEWAANAGVDPNSLGVFLGLPIRMNGQNLGVLAVATSAVPSVEHVALLDAIVDYLAVGAQIAHLHYQLQTQRELAQTVLREAPLAMAVVTPGDATIVLTNLRFDQLLHLGPDLWGRQLDIALPDHGPALRKVFQLDEVARLDETRVMFDMPVQLAEGLTFWDFTSSPLHDETGAISGILHIRSRCHVPRGATPASETLGRYRAGARRPDGHAPPHLIGGRISVRARSTRVAAPDHRKDGRARRCDRWHGLLRRPGNR